MTQRAGSHAGLVHEMDRARARAQVAENVRAVRPRVLRHRTGIAAGPRQPDCTVGATGVGPDLDEPGETPGPPITIRRLRWFVLENWPLLLGIVAVGLCTVHTFLGLTAAVYAVGALLVVGASVLVFIGVLVADKLPAPRIERRR